MFVRSTEKPEPQKGCRMESEEYLFLFKFPMYVLASEYTRDSEGKIKLDDRIQFAAPEYGGYACLALFTDEHLAEDFLEVHPDRGDMVAFPLDPDNLLTLLRRFAQNCERIAIDPYRKVRRGRQVLLHAFAESLQDWVNRGKPNDPIDPGFLP